MKRVHSVLLNDNCTVNDDGAVSFDSGVQYSADEIRALRGAPSGVVKNAHHVKMFFGGVVEYIPNHQLVRRREQGVEVEFPKIPIGKKAI
jgi:hypothetical protein